MKGCLEQGNWGWAAKDVFSLVAFDSVMTCLVDYKIEATMQRTLSNMFLSIFIPSL